MKKQHKRILLGLAAVGGVAGGYFVMRVLRRKMNQHYYGIQSEWSEPGPQYPPEELPRTMRRQLGAVPTVEHETSYPAQPERQPIPQTGKALNETTALAHDLVFGADEPVLAQDGGALAAMLIQHLLGFAAMMKLLRQRREDGPASERSLTPGDRERLEELLNRLSASYTDLGEGFFEEGSLRERVYRLAAKTRDAMQNLDYADADLFRINGEVRPEACRLLSEIRTANLAPMVNQDEVREEFRCV
jgi:hypothetical protein